MAARYDQILDAAPKFSTREYPNVDVNEVALEAGVATSTAHRYFPSSAHLLLALYRRQLLELRARVDDRAATARTDQQRARNLAGAAVEMFAMRLAQPAVNSCLSELVVPVEHELTALVGEVDELSWSILGRLAGDNERGRSIVHIIAGLVSAVRTGRLMPFEAERQLKTACEIVASRRAMRG
ncbi:helix-turn-helix domain-containing protein [Sinomonas sp. ASV486]|uniref:TetR/AcrR family transcriptional regulator n=1 Tax=Sinomonas sp. ASV486 TaxID=3051170 RepID=UPI0027DC1F00|nr:helix-turn-helix domain-containing protein [Sinomonas sp. ASV486]MDQ4489199.1 helix-turn-helix domain-containing protein [Sinomonas sp. ASV486]